MTELTPQKNHDDIMDLDKRISLSEQSQAYMTDSVLKIEKATTKFSETVSEHVKDLYKKVNETHGKSIKNEETIANHEIICGERQQTILDKVDDLCKKNETRHNEDLEYRRQRKTLELLNIDKTAKAAEDKRRWTIKTFLSVFFKMGGWFVVVVIALMKMFG